MNAWNEALRAATARLLDGLRPAPEPPPIDPNRPDWYVRWLAHQERATRRAEAAAWFIVLFVAGLVVVLGHLYLGCVAGVLCAAAQPPVRLAVDNTTTRRYPRSLDEAFPERQRYHAGDWQPPRRLTVSALDLIRRAVRAFFINRKGPL